MVTFSEISPSELLQKYESGMSISEVATSVNRSYSAVRKSLLTTGVSLRTKGEGTRMHIERHPEWARQFIKYHVGEPGITDDKILLLTMIITEGYVDRTSVGFTNVQHSLHKEFEKLFADVYGSVRVGKTGILSRVSSTEIAKDIASLMSEKSFNQQILEYLLSSKEVAVKALRIIADTEGSMIVSIKKAPRNYTVESRVVLASTNRGFRSQISALLASLGINSKWNADGVIVYGKADIGKFIQSVGFSPGVRVVRKKAGVSSWYGKEKYLLSKLSLRIFAEQERAKGSGMRGCFAGCRTREDTMGMLTSWYEEISGGER